MPCLIALLTVCFSRLAFLCLWIFTPLVEGAFSTFIGPLLGLAFLPFTLIMYVMLWTPASGVAGWEWLWAVVAFLNDTTLYASSAYVNRQEMQGFPGAT
jgi:hypothetical protein